jgi:methylated-DNA-[protein]-cysteine S-methyltransferase
MKTPRGGYTLFETPIGSCGIAWEGDRVKCIQLPEASDEETLARMRTRAGELGGGAKPPAWVHALGLAITRHLRGESQRFEAVPLDLDGIPPFRRKVYEAARKVGPAKTVTYGELADLAGKPGSARAVGQALSKNPFPIVVPCHRIVAAGNKPGGFTSWNGLDTKAKLLEAEGKKLFRGKGGLPYDWEKACLALCDAEPGLARVIERFREKRLEVEALSSPFESLLEAIVYQQLTGKAAATILGRVRALFPKVLTPRALLDIEEEKLRGAGLSRAKTLAVRDLAARTLDGTVPELSALERMSEEEIVERLTEIRGIGRWTVEMLLIFRLGRPDVLPATDYGVRKGFKAAFKKRDLPTPKQILARGEKWRPFRSVASFYLWRASEA